MTNAPPYNLPHNTTRLSTDAFIFQPLGSTSVDYTTRAEMLAGYAAAPSYPVYNVRQAPYNAVGNGIADDTAAIAAAISDASATNGGLVYLPAGVYQVSTTLNITSQGISLVGDGPNATIIRSFSTTADILKFGNGATPTKPGGCVRHLSIKSSVVRTAGYAISVDGAAYGEITDVLIATNGGHGIVMSPSAANLAAGWFVHHCEIDIIGAFTAITVNNSNDDYFSDLFLAGNSTTGSIGILVTASDGDWWTNIDVVLFDRGVEIKPASAGSTIRWHTFTNVLCDTCNTFGWNLTNPSAGTIAGMQFLACWAGTNGTASTSARGFRITSGNGILLTAPRVLNNGGIGIEINAATNVRLIGGLVAGNSAASSGNGNAIDVTGGANIHISGVRAGQAAGMANSQKYGIAIDATATSWEVIGCDCTTNVTGGLSLGSALSATQIAVGNLPVGPESYAFKLGLAGGQTVIGGTGSAEALVLQSTSHATKGLIQFGTSGYDEAGNNLGLGTTTFGGSAARVLALANGTAPTTSPSNKIQLWALAAQTNDSNLYARNEGGRVERLTGLAVSCPAQFNKAADTTIANVTNFTCNVDAGLTYFFTVRLYVTADATGGYKVSMGGTATATSVTFDVDAKRLDTSASTITSRIAALGTTAGAAGGTTIQVTITGTIKVNAAGYFGPQFAQNAASGTSSVLVGSFMEMRATGL